ncbi:cation diffusion facilitator family transporter [Calidithermus timidus]|jgi:cation diffusion facilitator family transporter|uniref:cation diffusion facilitator family transporter n=1 Tax=Calidithermus timidus TaxID=307124 RepID=UPI0003747E60|nr:cation diffusion facilitator family transporter [Calidithermus timidus]
MQPLQAAYLSLLVGCAIFALKWTAYRLTGSVALLSDALESIVNIVAALAALWAVGLSRRPADANHPYGHSKAEYFSAVLEGVLIVLAAFTIVREAWPRLLAPSAPHTVGVGLLISLLASGLNLALASFLMRSGKVARSPALVADAHHVLSDVITSLGVLMGMGLAWLTGFWLLDPLLAIVVAGNILWVGWKLVRDSVGGLMDESLKPEELQQIRQALHQAVQGLVLQDKVIEIHDLKTRRAGPSTFAELHLVVPGEMSVAEAHEICDQLEETLRQLLPGAQLTVHVEPEFKAKHTTFTIG